MRRKLARLKIDQLLRALLLLVLFGPAASELPYGYAAVVGLSLYVLMGCLHSIETEDPRRRIGFALLVPIGAITTIHFFVSLKWLAALDHILLVAFLVIIIQVLLGHIMSRREVSNDIIGAGLAVYLVVGLLFADTYALFELLQPGSFDFGEQFKTVAGHAEHARVYSTRFIYYSLVTLTTLGLGDVTPASTLARSFSAVEAVIGPVFLAVFIGQLVGMRAAQRTDNSSD